MKEKNTIIAEKHNEKCCICPRNCNVNRTEEELGFCSVGKTAKVARVSLHYWEEPCISGQNGSGTVFFSGCNLKCCFCQNREISGGKAGKYISIERLAEIFLEQQSRGAANINLVTPSHYVEIIRDSLILAKANGLRLPVVWNSSCYEKVETLKNLSGLVDVYMPDFKYFSDELSLRYSKAKDYFSVAKAALEEMFRQQPKVSFDSNGMMQKGCLVRHMVLPMCTDDSKKVLSYLFNEYGNDLYYSIMCQYTPFGNLTDFPEINRKLSENEYDEVIDFAIDLGIENAFVQDSESADESFIPQFDCRGV